MVGVKYLHAIKVELTMFDWVYCVDHTRQTRILCPFPRLSDKQMITSSRRSNPIQEHRTVSWSIALTTSQWSHIVRLFNITLSFGLWRQATFEVHYYFVWFCLPFKTTTSTNLQLTLIFRVISVYVFNRFLGYQYSTAFLIPAPNIQSILI